MLEKKLCKMNTTWDCPFSDFTSNVQDAWLRSLSRYDTKPRESQLFFFLKNMACLTEMFILNQYPYYLCISFLVNMSVCVHVILSIFFLWLQWFVYYPPRPTQKTQTMLWSMVPHVTFKQRSWLRRKRRRSRGSERKRSWTILWRWWDRFRHRAHSGLREETITACRLHSTLYSISQYDSIRSTDIIF